MSFRGRLWSCPFALIVIVPMIALAIVLFSLTASSETGKADAEVAQGMRSAFALHGAESRQVRDDARRVAADPALRRAVVDNRVADARARIGELVGGDVETIEIRSPSGRLLGRAGPASAVAAQGATIEREDGQPVAVLRVFGTRRVGPQQPHQRPHRPGRRHQPRRRPGLAAPRVGSRQSAPARAAHGELRESSAVESVNGDEYRARIERIEEPGGPPIEIFVLQPADALADRIMRNRVIIGVLLVAFLILALAGAWVIGRALTGQVDEFLAAAKRLARGDFRRPVPIYGDDEFAQLGREFHPRTFFCIMLLYVLNTGCAGWYV